MNAAMGMPTSMGARQKYISTRMIRLQQELVQDKHMLQDIHCCTHALYDTRLETGNHPRMQLLL